MAFNEAKGHELLILGVKRGVGRWALTERHCQ